MAQDIHTKSVIGSIRRLLKGCLRLKYPTKYGATQRTQPGETSWGLDAKDLAWATNILTFHIISSINYLCLPLTRDPDRSLPTDNTQLCPIAGISKF